MIDLLERLRDMCTHGRFYSSEIPAIDMWIALEIARRGDRDDAVPLARAALVELFGAGQFAYWVVGAGMLGEMLVERGDNDDLIEVGSVIDQLVAAPLSGDYVARNLTLLRLRALLARARGDDAGYRDFAARYRTMATDLGFEGHMALAEAM